MEKLPSVSVIIPVYNDAQRLQQTLEALCAQTYPSARYEVIVVDNGSTDESVEVARRFSEVTALSETRHTASPYSARNRGIEAARGEVIALLDATCVPDEKWIDQGIQCLTGNAADLVGGEVRFVFQDDPTAGELFDALVNIRMKESIERGKAKTANLFVRREMFDTLGLFPEGLRSGGDVRWTRQAVNEGHVLAFCEGAVVYKSARTIWPLLRKQWRVAKAQPDIWRKEGRKLSLIKALILAVIPPRLSVLKKKIRESKYPEAEEHLFKLWLVNYLVGFVMRFGQGYALVRQRLTYS